MASHISKVYYNVRGITTESCLGYIYIYNLNRPSLNVLDYQKKTSFIFPYLRQVICA